MSSTKYDLLMSVKNFEVLETTEQKIVLQNIENNLESQIRMFDDLKSRLEKRLERTSFNRRNALIKTYKSFLSDLEENIFKLTIRKYSYIDVMVKDDDMLIF